MSSNREDWRKGKKIRGGRENVIEDRREERKKERTNTGEKRDGKEKNTMGGRETK